MQFFETKHESAIVALLHFRAPKCMKMAGHPCPAQAPRIFRGALNPHFSPESYCGRRSTRIFRPYSLRAPQRSVGYAFVAPRSVRPDSAGVSAPSLRPPGEKCGLSPGPYHRPGINRKRTRCTYSAYPASSARSVRSSSAVRTTRPATDSTAGMKAHHDCNNRGAARIQPRNPR